MAHGAYNPSCDAERIHLNYVAKSLLYCCDSTLFALGDSTLGSTNGRLEIPTHVIKATQVKAAVDSCIATYIDALWATPTSFSGKYHPLDERGATGLVRHIIKQFRLIGGIVMHFNLTARERDVLYAASFFHDIAKVHHQTSIGHELASASIAEAFLSEAGVDGNILAGEWMAKQIVDIVKCHTAAWRQDLPQPKMKLEFIFSMLDYIVAQDYVVVDIGGYVP